MKLFDENGKYTPEGIKLDREVRIVAAAIFGKWKMEGCSIRDISHVMILAATMTESVQVLTEGVKRHKEEKP